MVQNNRYLFSKSFTVGTGRQNRQHPGRHGKHMKHRLNADKLTKNKGRGLMYIVWLIGK